MLRWREGDREPPWRGHRVRDGVIDDALGGGLDWWLGRGPTCPSLFADARYTWTEEGLHFALIRAGFEFNLQALRLISRKGCRVRSGGLFLLPEHRFRRFIGLPLRMSHQADRIALREDQDRLRRMLERTVGRLAEAGETGIVHRPEVSILDVACGACDEAETLSDFFRDLRGEAGGKAAATRLVGTDVRERELDEARARFQDGPERCFEFFRGDASKLDGHRELAGEFDVLFFRHQNLYHGRTLWQKIFEQGLARLRDDGLLVITSYFDREHALALQAFQKLGVEVVVTERNPESRALVTPGKSVDRHVAVLRKRREG